MRRRGDKRLFWIELLTIRGIMQVTNTEDTAHDPILNWSDLDIEQRIGFQGAKYTHTNTALTFLAAVLLSSVFFGILYGVRGSTSSSADFASRFTDHGLIPFLIVLFSAWSFSILAIKHRKLAIQLKALDYDVVPVDAGFVLSSATVDQVMARIYSLVDDPRHFVLYHRIVIALANLRNIGRISDVDEILRSQAENDEATMETSYSLVQGFVWVVPVLGFVGTVIGLSQAMGNFGGVLPETSAGVSHAELSGLLTELRGVTKNLRFAFDTTLQGLVAAIVIQITMTFLRKNEEEFLDLCHDYCLRQVVARLRVMPFDAEDH